MKRTPLTPDPDKVREWLRQSAARAPLRRSKGLARGVGKGGPSSGLERRKTLAPGRRKRRKTIPAPIRAHVLARSGGNCVACEARRRAAPARRDAIRRAVHLHHVLPVQRWPKLELEPDNMVGVCAACHDNHERAHERLPLAALPWEAVELAAAVGPAAHDYVKKHYPKEVAP